MAILYSHAQRIKFLGCTVRPDRDQKTGIVRTFPNFTCPSPIPETLRIENENEGKKDLPAELKLDILPENSTSLRPLSLSHIPLTNQLLDPTDHCYNPQTSPPHSPRYSIFWLQMGDWKISRSHVGTSSPIPMIPVGSPRADFVGLNPILHSQTNPGSATYASHRRSLHSSSPRWPFPHFSFRRPSLFLRWPSRSPSSNIAPV